MKGERDRKENKEKWKATYTGNEDDGLKTLSKDGDEGKHEQDPLGTSALSLVLLGQVEVLLVDEGDRVLLVPLEERLEEGLLVGLGVEDSLRVESGLELDAPLGSRSVETTFSEERKSISTLTAVKQKEKVGRHTGRQHPSS